MVEFELSTIAEAIVKFEELSTLTLPFTNVYPLELFIVTLALEIELMTFSPVMELFNDELTKPLKVIVSWVFAVLKLIEPKITDAEPNETELLKPFFVEPIPKLMALPVPALMVPLLVTSACP